MLKTKVRRGYFYAFVLVLTAFAAASQIPHAFPSVPSRAPSIVISLLLLIAGSLTFLEVRKPTPVLQLVAGLGMIASVFVVIALDPIATILVDAAGGSLRLRAAISRIGSGCVPAGPFNIVWLVDDMIGSQTGSGFLLRVFGRDIAAAYYLHGVVGFLFWLLFLFRISADERFKTDAELSTREAPDRAGSVRVSEFHDALRTQSEELQGFFNQALVDRMCAVETRREIAKAKLLQNHVYFTLTIVGCLVFGFRAALQHIGESTGFGTAVFIVTIAYVIAVSFYWPYRARRDKRGYVAEFKQEIIRKLVMFVDPELDYSPDESIGLQDFLRGSIFRVNPGIYNGSDYVSGGVDGRPFAFSELCVQKRLRRYDPVIFRGLYVIVESSIRFSGETFVLPATGRTRYGGRMWRDRGRRIESGDPEFDALFAVYTSNPDETTRWLAPELRSDMVQYIRSRRQTVLASLKEDEVHIAIARHRSIFDPPIYSTALNVALITRYFHDVNRVLETVRIAALSVST